MEFRTLGRSGLKVSLIGLGCNNFGVRADRAASQAVIHKALDCGITLFDTADIYGNRGGSETLIGEILGAKRKEIVLASKFGMEMDDEGRKVGGSRRHIMAAVEASLTRLKTDWLDLYQYHRPDPATPIDETLRALDDLVRQGKVRYIGCSNLPAWQMVASRHVSREQNLEPFISCQDEYSLLHREPEQELLPAARAYGLGLLPYFPLAAGLLTGKYRRNAPMPAEGRITLGERYQTRYLTEANWEKTEKLADFAAGHGHTLLELAFSWLASEPVVASVIAGATKPEQVEANVKAVTWKLSAEDRAAIDAITKPV